MIRGKIGVAALSACLVKCVLFCAGVSSEGMGPFDVVVQSVGHCPKTVIAKELITYDGKLQRLSRKRLTYSANISFSIPLDDNLGVELKVAKKTSQGWKDNFFVMDFQKACSTMLLYVPDIFKEMARQFKVNRDQCPLVTSGNYSCTITLNVDITSIPMFTYSKYRSRVFFVRKADPAFCMEIMAEVVPKQKGGK